MAAGFFGGLGNIVGKVGNLPTYGNDPRGDIGRYGLPPNAPPGLGDVDWGEIQNRLKAQQQQTDGGDWPPQSGPDVAASGVNRYNAQSQADQLKATLAYQAQQQGLGEKGFDITDAENFLSKIGLDLQGRSMDVQQAGIGAAAGQLQSNTAAQRRGLFSQAAASGSTTSQGVKQGLTDIATNFQYNLGGLYRQLQNLAINRQGLDLSRGQLDLSGQRNQLSRQSSELAFGYGQQNTQRSLNELLNALNTPGYY